MAIASAIDVCRNSLCAVSGANDNAVQAGSVLRCRINDDDVGNNDGTMQVIGISLTNMTPPLEPGES